MLDFKFNKGSLVRCRFSGAQGIIKARTDYLTGCNRYGVQPNAIKDGLPVDYHWFDEKELELIEDKKFNFDDEDPPGGEVNKDQIPPR